MEAPFVRSEYNYDMNEASDASGLECKDDSLAKQSFAEECDINTIVRRFRIGGELPTNVRMPTYGDYSNVTDFHTAMNAVALANEAFDAMPADVRARFNNDPGAFVDFCSDDKNREEARKMGLLVPEAASLAADAPLVRPESGVASAPATGPATPAPVSGASPVPVAGK